MFGTVRRRPGFHKDPKVSPPVAVHSNTFKCDFIGVLGLPGQGLGRLYVPEGQVPDVQGVIWFFNECFGAGFIKTIEVYAGVKLIMELKQ